MLYEILDTFKSKMGYSAIAAFVLHISLLAVSLGSKKVVYSIEEKIENKKRINLALTNYGLK